MKIHSGEWGETDLVILVPDSREYHGRSNRADIVMSTSGEGLQIGLRSKLSIHTARRKPLLRRIIGVLGL